MVLANRLSTRRGIEGRGWVIQCYDGDIGTALERVAYYASYAPLVAADTIQILSSASGDQSIPVYIVGIDSSGNEITETITTNAADGTTAVDSTNTFEYIVDTYVDSVIAGNITIRRKTGPATINQITLAEYYAPIAHHFSPATEKSYITSWGAANILGGNTIYFILVSFATRADWLTNLKYKELDRIAFTNEVSSQYHVFSDQLEGGIECPAGGVIEVKALAGAASQQGAVTVIGFDK